MHLRSTLSVAAFTMIAVLSACPANAQPGRRSTPATTKALDVQAERIETEFLKGLAELANKYEEAGDTEKAAEMLKSILRIKPDVESVKAKLKAFDEAVFRTNEVIIEVDAAQNWVNAGVAVQKNKPIRIQSNGTYKFIVNENLGPQGFISRDPARDLVAGIPTGALMGMVAPVQQGGKRKKDQPTPFFIGAESEFSPKESGVLYFKLNVPSSSHCIGKVKVRINGNISR